MSSGSVNTMSLRMGSRLAGLALLSATVFVVTAGWWYALGVIPPAIALGSVPSVGSDLAWYVTRWFLLAFGAAMVAIGIATWRGSARPWVAVGLTVATLGLGAVHVELVHSQVHLACVCGTLQLNCAPWFPDALFGAPEVSKSVGKDSKLAGAVASECPNW